MSVNSMRDTPQIRNLNSLAGQLLLQTVLSCSTIGQIQEMVNFSKRENINILELHAWMEKQYH